MHQLADLPLVSVIIPTFNSEKNIKRCLQSIRTQEYRRVETIVVDSYSTDRTVEESRKLGARLLLLSGERSEAKNYAAEKAKGEFVFFVDSDMRLKPNVISECLKAYYENKVHGIVVPEKCIGYSLFGKCREVEKNFLSASGIGDLPRFFRKYDFLSLGGFDEKLVCGEDFDFFQRFSRSGFRVAKAMAEIEHFEGSPSLAGILQKSYSYGRTIPNLAAKRPQETFRKYAGIRVLLLREMGSYVNGLKFPFAYLLMVVIEYFGYFGGVFASTFGNSASKWFGKLATVMQRNILRIAVLSLFTLITVIIFRNFLFTRNVPAGNDLYGWVSREYIFAREYRWLYIWRPYSFGFVEGVNLIDMFFMLTHFVFPEPVQTIEAFMIISFLLAGFSMYVFAYSYTHSDLAGFGAALVYTLNQWHFSQITEGHVDLNFSYSFAPLLFLFADRALKNGRTKGILISAIAMAVFVSGFHANAVVIYGLFLLVFIATYLLYPDKNVRFRNRGKRLLKFLLICGLITALLTAFYTIPFFTGVKAQFLSEEYKYQIEEAESFGATNLTEAFTLGATEEGGYLNVLDVRKGFGPLDFPVQDLLLLVFLISYSTILVRRDRYTVFFLVAGIISVFISKGPNPPLGSLFTWAWFNVPYFAVFRRPNRWEMMTAFSNAFFVAVFISMSWKLFKNLQFSNRYTSANTGALQKVFKKSQFSFSLLSEWHSFLKNALRFASVAFIVLIFLGSLISCSFFFFNGALTYKIPKSYTQAFYWTAEQNGDYKIATINKGPSEWMNDPFAETDFAFCRMLTDIGWAHDLGFDSAVFHDKPVLQDGGWEPSSKAFVDYLRRSLVYNNLTSDFLKILGCFGYKYVIIPSYSSEKVKAFVLGQEGSSTVFDENGSIVLENSYFTPRIFSPSSSAIVIGGLECLPIMSKIESFKLNETAMLFMNSNSALSFISNSSMNLSDAIIFANGGSLIDVIPLLMEDLGDLILAKNYAVPSSNMTKYWVTSSFWRDRGGFVLGKDTLTTRGKCKIDMPFSIAQDSEYEVWIRLAYAPDRGELSLYLDGELVEKLKPEADFWTTLRWLKIPVSEIPEGSHVLTLSNDGTGYNDVDAVCIAEKTVFQAKFAEYLGKLQSFDGRLICLLRPEDFLEGSNVSKWLVFPQPYEGNVLRGENEVNLSYQASANASSVEDRTNLKASYAIDGNYTTRWASTPFEELPQWLELDWPNPHDVTSVKISFEHAKAEDYEIQTWNEKESIWETQVNITGNTEMQRLHSFEKPVETSKLRLYVAKYDGFEAVSVYEFEVYEEPEARATLPLVRNGTYQCYVRANSNEELGKLRVKIGEKLSEISLHNTSSEYRWFDAGTFNLSTYDNTLELDALGKVEVSQILLYSLQSNETSLPLEQLFGNNRSDVLIEYIQENPCRYRLKVNADKPFFLVFSESYNPLWKILAGDESISSFPAYSLVNGYFINKTGDFELILYFAGQSYVDLGLRIASVSFVAIVTMLLIPSRIYNSILRKLKKPKENLRP